MKPTIKALTLLLTLAAIFTALHAAYVSDVREPEQWDETIGVVDSL
ncbi:MAG: hypothetical protein WBX20_12960 [Terrimicrobiaceae bacterium]